MKFVQIASAIFVLLPLGGILYRQYAAPPTDHIMLGVLICSGFLAAGVFEELWGLIFLQALIVLPFTMWGVRRKRKRTSGR